MVRTEIPKPDQKKGNHDVEKVVKREKREKIVQFDEKSLTKHSSLCPGWSHLQFNREVMPTCGRGQRP